MTVTLQKTSDQRITFQRTWEKFKLIQQGFEDSLGIKLAYCDGAIEILMPGFEHENFSEIIGYISHHVFAGAGDWVCALWIGDPGEGRASIRPGS